MNTFLPHPDFKTSLSCLDRKRLLKQTVETKQILNALLGVSKGWANHPATLMWKGYENALIEYYNISYELNKQNGVKYKKLEPIPLKGQVLYPNWLGYEPFHASMRGNLIRKNSEHYRKYGWTDNPIEGYLWPVDKNGLISEIKNWLKA